MGAPCAGEGKQKTLRSLWLNGTPASLCSLPSARGRVRVGEGTPRVPLFPPLFPPQRTGEG